MMFDRYLKNKAIDNAKKAKLLLELKALQEKQETESKFESWRKNPMLWLEERFGENAGLGGNWTSFGGYDSHEWDGTVNPLAAMWKAVADNRWAGVTSGTGTGKTYTLARIVFWFLDCFENSLVVTSAPKQDQLKLHLWSEISRAFSKFQKIRPHAVLNKGELYVDSSNSDFKDSWMASAFVAGVTANAESTTKAQGFHREHMLIITEETPGMPMPTMTAFMNTATGEHNPILAVGNPDGMTDTLSTFMRSSPSIANIRISSYDHPNVVLKKERIPGAVSQKSINQKADAFGVDSPMFRSRVRGIPPEQGSNSLIKLAWIRAAWVEHEADFTNWDYSENAVGVDVANSYNGDAGGVCYGKQNLVTLIKEFQCPSASHLAYNLFLSKEEMQDRGVIDYGLVNIFEAGIHNDMVGVDAVGLGVSTINTMQDNGLPVFPIMGGAIKDLIPKDNEGNPLYNFKSIRSQAVWMLREDLQHGRIGIICNDSLVRMQIEKELSCVTYEVKDNSLNIESKDKIKQKLGGKSPTYLDVLSYWNITRKRSINAGDLPFWTE